MNSTDILLGSNDYSDNDVLKSNFANKSGPSFSFEQLPTAYFAENQSSKLLRKQLKKNILWENLKLKKQFLYWLKQALNDHRSLGLRLAHRMKPMPILMQLMQR